ncbi:hypothetical protein GIB67_001261 [Kingdonia uniflora]|uniref:RING-type E3 ubiquitin transferase n=1 Tax=Kingdonia uniflora TaxID=39325 RepID=A0A7J7LHS8_9MAGN|nr:hypothetical protein GIB67_001261 [Kingdonia uniflora]
MQKVFAISINCVSKMEQMQSIEININIGVELLRGNLNIEVFETVGLENHIDYEDEGQSLHEEHQRSRLNELLDMRNSENSSLAPLNIEELNLKSREVDLLVHELTYLHYNFKDQYSNEEYNAAQEKIISAKVNPDFRVKTIPYVLSPSTDEESETCAICLDEIKNGKNIGSLQCGHEYHINCIKRWLRVKDLCPKCKRQCLPF